MFLPGGIVLQTQPCSYMKCKRRGSMFANLIPNLKTVTSYTNMSIHQIDALLSNASETSWRRRNWDGTLTYRTQSNEFRETKPCYEGE
eukprot:6476582-Amphidinium_carterae.1